VFVNKLQINSPTTSPIWIGSKQGGAYLSTADNNEWRSVNIGLQNPSDATGFNAIRLPAITCFATDGLSKIFAGSGAVNAGILGGGVFVMDVIADNDQWGQSNTGLSNTDVRAIAFGNTKLLAGTNGGGVFRSSDNGATWAASNTGLGNLVVLALLYDPNNVGTFYAATSGGVYKSTDSGASWSAVNTGLTTTTCLSLGMASDASAIYVGCTNGKIFKTTNGGGSWSLVFTEGSGFPIQGLAVSQTALTNVFAATGGAGMYTSLNSGTTWAQTNTGLVDQQASAALLNISAVATDTLGNVYIAPIGNTYLVALHNNGGAFRSADNAATWVFIANSLTYGGGYSAVGTLAPCTFVGNYSESGQNNWIVQPSIIVGGVLGTEVIPPPDGYPTQVVTGSGIYGTQLFGPVRPKIRTYTNLNQVQVLSDDAIILVNVPSGHTCVVVLPSPSTPNRMVTIQKNNSSLYPVEISGTLQGSLGHLYLDQLGANVTLVSTGTQWIFLNVNNINNPSVNELLVAGTPNYPVLGGIPVYAGNYLITIYYRVTVSATDVNIFVTWNDVTGAQTATIVNAAAQPVGSYAAVPIVINSLAGDANEFIVKATVNHVNQVYVSCGVKFMS
jgi:photosystem II stability/assembly factor-like uncharacterized protein